jgi:hypothetical protein
MFFTDLEKTLLRWSGEFRQLRDRLSRAGGCIP